MSLVCMHMEEGLLCTCISHFEPLNSKTIHGKLLVYADIESLQRIQKIRFCKESIETLSLVLAQLCRTTCLENQDISLFISQKNQIEPVPFAEF